MYFNQTFSALLEEAQFTKELLAIGTTQLYKANYATRGIYYQSFTCLSTGIERIEKLCLILDFYYNHHGQFPSEDYIRTHGHRILSLFSVSQHIAKEQNISIRHHCNLQDAIHQSILTVLDHFAESKGRYANINILLGKEFGENDCVQQWYQTVDMPLYEKCVTLRKKEKIERNAQAIGTALNSFSVIRFSSENNAEIANAIEASRRTEVWEAVAPYRQLYMLQIIRYLSELLIGLGYKANSVDSENIPLFSEIFGLFCNRDSYFRTRKTWDTLK